MDQEGGRVVVRVSGEQEETVGPAAPGRGAEHGQGETTGAGHQGTYTYTVLVAWTC